MEKDNEMSKNKLSIKVNENFTNDWTNLAICLNITLAKFI